MFDFIVPYQAWVDQFVEPLLTWIFDPTKGSEYEFMTAQLLMVLVYVAGILTFVVIGGFVISFSKGLFYFLMEKLGF